MMNKIVRAIFHTAQRGLSILMLKHSELGESLEKASRLDSSLVKYLVLKRGPGLLPFLFLLMLSFVKRALHVVYVVVKFFIIPLFPDKRDITTSLVG